MTKSEALEKVKQLMKEAVAKKNAMPGFKYSFVEDSLNNLHMALQLGKITGDDAELTIQQVEGVLAQYSGNPAVPAASGTSGTSGSMTPEEYKAAKSAMYQKYKAGEITNYAYIQWKKKNDPALQAAGGDVSAGTAKGGTSAASTKQAAKPATDPGQQAADDAVEKLEKELKKVYKESVKDMTAKLKEFTDEYADKLTEKQQLVAEGKMTQAELKSWIDHQGDILDIMNQKVDQMAGVMLNANQKAMGMINGETLNVFAENANWQSYQLTQDTKMNLMFSAYDESTVKKLIQDKPELLPRKVVNGKKDKAWNKTKIANAVVQAVIQGESIQTLARRISVQTGETNMKAMVRYARTAMTSAQNSGRQEMLHRAKGMGIQCKKTWLATLDSRTRDIHAKLDGQTVDVDEPFHSELGDILFPGDMGSKGSTPANLYNCRCTLIYEYEGYPNDPTEDMRYDNETGQLIADMSYSEWKAAKEGSKLNDLSAAKLELAELQKQLVKKKIKEDKVYEGLWKEPVTLADYPAKKAGINAKRDYYTAEIEKYKQAQAEGKSWATDEKIKELEKKRKLLNEFDLNGRMVEKRNAALQAVQDIYSQINLQKNAAAPAVPQKATKTAKKAASGSAGMDLSSAGEKKTPFGPEAYSKDRKDKALWTTDRKKVDDVMRQHTGEMWLKATPEEREAIHEYTYTYKKFNEPLRGIEYGTSRYLGVGKTDLNAGSKRSGKKLNAITDLLERCSYNHDMWLQRGVRFDGMDKFFNCSMSLLQRGTQKQLQDALLGTTPTEYAFGSMGSAKGKGFSGDILLNIYAPAGTKMMFLEPFSYYGHNKNGGMSGMDGVKWDGKSKQPSYGTEFETLLQQGTQFRVTKVERRGSGTIYVDLEVINQDNQQRWKP